VTLVLALVWGRGVLVTADSRASTGIVFHEERKIQPIYFVHEGEEYDLAVVGGSGDSALVKQGFTIIRSIFKQWFAEKGFKEKRNPFVEEVENIVSEIESRLLLRYRNLRSVGVEPSVSLLLATVSQDGKPLLYVFDDRGLAEPMHDNPGYALLGKGVVTGGLLLLRLLDYRPDESWDWDLGLLSAFIIDMVSEVDPSVSPFLGESIYIRYDDEKKRVVLGPLREESYKEYKDKIKRRRDIVKMLWSTLEVVGEDDVKEALNKLRQIKSSNMQKYTVKEKS